MDSSPQTLVLPDDFKAEILRLGRAQNLTGAIELCRKACAKFPSDGWYHRFAGDIFFLLENYDSASKAYLDYIERMPQDRDSFIQFAQRYNRLRRAWTREKISEYALAVMMIIEKGDVLSEEISIETRNLISSDLPEHIRVSVPLSGEGKQLKALFNKKVRWAELVKQSRAVERRNKLELIYLLDQFVLMRERSKERFAEDSYWVSVYEKLEEPQKALKITEELLKLRIDRGLVRTFFRLCRKIGSYEQVNIFIDNHPDIINSTAFHILYELVYYYDFYRDSESVRATLEKIRKGYPNNDPIRKTLKNLYIRFGMVSEANQLEKDIKQDSQGRGSRGNRHKDGEYADILRESEVELGSKIKGLYEELEVTKRLAAISDLTTGISHEFGQPITNIRYAIQFYRKEFESHLTKEEVFRVFDSILEETQRMGGLVKRLAPLTSSRAVVEDFDLIDRINKRVSAEKARLHAGGVQVLVYPDGPIFFHGDPVKFDQLISNLLLNSIDAINESARGSGRVRIQVVSNDSRIGISFADNGPGIPIADRNKVFDPFYTTKAPGKGEGLGLFIVWNLLKMQGGQISIDPNVKSGTRFLITIPRVPPEGESEKDIEEHTTSSRG
jgi:signal transduction histidine kinase